MIDVSNNYIHSRVTTAIIDNSIVDEVTTTPIGFVLFQPYISQKGMDGKVRRFLNETDYVRRSGVPRITRDGQHIYNGIQWLKGGGTLLGLRVTADNAKPAFAVLNIRTKPSTVTLTSASARLIGEGEEFKLNQIGSFNGKLYKCTVETTVVPAGGAVAGSVYLTDNFQELGDVNLQIPTLKISPTICGVPDSFLNMATLGLSEPLMLKQLLTRLNGTTSDAGNGWTNNYLTIFKLRGSGKFGNNYSVSLTLDQTREEDLEDGRRYFYSIFEKDDKGNIALAATGSTISVAFNPDAVDSTGTVSEFIDTKITDTDYIKKIDNIGILTSDDTWESLQRQFEPYCDEVKDATGTLILSEAQDPRFIDFISLADRSGKPYVRFINPAEEDLVFFDNKKQPDMDLSASDNFFVGGDDGDLDRDRYVVGTKDPSVNDNLKYYASKKEADEAYDAVKNELFRRAYAGEIDSNILSPYKYQISAVIDAANVDAVKKEMIYFCRKRLDVMAYIDCGFIASCSAAINYKKTVLNGLQDWQSSLWPQSGVAWDAYNRRNIDVTYCYDIAFKLPWLRANYGPNRLMAGTEKGILQTMTSLSWYPDEDQKTELIKEQMNYVEEVRLNQYAIMSVRTMYLKRLSYLAVIRNCHAVCEAIWVGRQILTDLRFEEKPEIAMVKAKEKVGRDLAYLQMNGPVERMTIKTEQTLQDKYDNAASLYIEMKFTDFIQTWNFYVVAAR